MASTSTQRPTHILIADHHEKLRETLQYNFEKNGFHVTTAQSGADALSKVTEETCVALLDLEMPEVDGLECLRHIRKSYKNTLVIIMSETGKIEEAVDAIKSGALDYVIKPFDLEHITSIVLKAVHLAKMSRENDDLHEAIGQSKPISEFTGQSKGAKEILDQIPVIAPLDSGVLITGESGVGKGLLARTIHYASTRSTGPFVSVSCPSLPRELLESEMFGHEKGAFTGAMKRRVGRAEMANNGTLFLDELADLPLNLQPKLLTFLQEKTFQRIGGEATLTSNVRVIAATNADLQQKVDAGEFRKDLFFRLNVFSLNIPPLRKRKEDLNDLCLHILKRIAETREQDLCKLSPETMRAIHEYNWPGNVRELENVLERASAFCSKGEITPNNLPGELSAEGASFTSTTNLAGKKLYDIEKKAVMDTLDLCGGNKAEAARRLGITEKSVYNKIKRYQLK